MSFPYKHILVIGATSGIGLAMATRLIENGAKVTVVGRREDRLKEFVSKYGEDKANHLVFDISEIDKTPQFVKDATAKYPDIDSVYINAVHTNFTAAVALVHAFLPFLKEKAEKGPASLIFTGTNLSIIPAAPMPAYSASKTALNVFVLTLREQLNQSSKLKIIEVSPPAVQTELHDYMGPHGASVGMPLNQFADEAFAGLQKGLDQVIVGQVGDREVFMELVEKRRTAFEKLSAFMRKLHAK